MDKTNAHKLQALLYAHGGEMKKSNVTSLMQISAEELTQYAMQLREMIANSGLEIIETEQTISLRTSPEYSEFVAELQRKDTEKDLGNAGLEVLAIVLYKEGASRATIDYIRGVNSSGTLRQLVLRGLLERTRDSDDSRAWVYTATPECLAHLGVSSMEQLPEFEVLAAALREPPQQHMTPDEQPTS